MEAEKKTPNHSTDEAQKSTPQTTLEEIDEIVQVKLKCQGCGSIININRAIKDHWGICETCGSFLCKTCQVDYSTYSENVCPGSKIFEHHQIKITTIPVDILMEYVKQIPEQLETNPVFKAFFEAFSKQADPFGEIMYEFSPLIKIRNKYEENWLKLKNIIVRKANKSRIIRY